MLQGTEEGVDGGLGLDAEVGEVLVAFQIVSLTPFPFVPARERLEWVDFRLLALHQVTDHSLELFKKQ